VRRIDQNQASPGSLHARACFGFPHGGIPFNVALVKFLVPLLFLITLLPAHATPAAAERARKAYQLGIERWVLETRLANTPEERAAAERNRPDPAEAAREVWRAISPELNRDWILPHAAWFIQMTDGMDRVMGGETTRPNFQSELATLFGAIRKHHIQSSELAPVCIALSQNGGPDRLSLLEQIRTGSPHATVQGVASLAEAIAMKSLGDEPQVIAKRLQLIREAIIKSADTPIDGRNTVASVAEEEIYIITNLTKGRTAPDLAGTDTAGRNMKLSDHAGKIVVLFFWSAADANAREIIDFLNAMNTRMRGRPVVLLGVNVDDTAVLRPLEADGTVTWRNFSDPGGRLASEYRISSTPVCFVIDGERTIQHMGALGSFIELTVLALLEPKAE
jgi:peroxiredoxin